MYVILDDAPAVYYHVMDSKDADGCLEVFAETKDRRLIRRTLIELGRTYQVAPLNPRKKKHRGRVCKVRAFDEDFMPRFAVVQFMDNGRIGKVDLEDLADAAK